MIADITENENMLGRQWNKRDVNGNLDPFGELEYVDVVVMERAFSPAYYYVPIKLSEIQRSSLEQNPGY